MKKWIMAVAVAGAMATGTASAQVANGTFDHGPTAWTFKESVFAQSMWTNCGNTNYLAIAADYDDTPTLGHAPAAGRVAQATAPKPYTVGKWTLCRQMEQAVHVPHGTQLKFANKIGVRLEGVNGPTYIASGTLAVMVVDGASTTVVFSQTASSRKCDSDPQLCPRYFEQTVDMSAYWGKNVTLVFRGTSAGENTQTSQMFVDPSPVWVDGVRLQ